MRVKDLGPLETARKSRGWTQQELADRSGVLQGNISAYEAGAKTLGIGAARKLGKALDANPTLLVIHSQKTRLEKAKKRGDAADAILAAKAIVEVSEGLPLEDEDEQALDLMVAQVLDFAEKVGTYQDPERYGVDAADGRDLLGVKQAAKSVGAVPDEGNFFNLHPSHRDQSLRDELPL